MISLNQLTIDAYRALRYAIIKAAEAEILRPYPDSNCLPTIGLGLNLRPVGRSPPVVRKYAIGAVLPF
jgi:hypothetical protein